MESSRKKRGISLSSQPKRQEIFHIHSLSNVDSEESKIVYQEEATHFQYSRSNFAGQISRHASAPKSKITFSYHNLTAPELPAFPNTDVKQKASWLEPQTGQKQPERSIAKTPFSQGNLAPMTFSEDKNRFEEYKPNYSKLLFGEPTGIEYVQTRLEISNPGIVRTGDSRTESWNTRGMRSQPKAVSEVILQRAKNRWISSERGQNQVQKRGLQHSVVFYQQFKAGPVQSIIAPIKLPNQETLKIQAKPYMEEPSFREKPKIEQKLIALGQPKLDIARQVTFAKGKPVQKISPANKKFEISKEVVSYKTAGEELQSRIVEKVEKKENKNPETVEVKPQRKATRDAAKLKEMERKLLEIIQICDGKL